MVKEMQGKRSGETGYSLLEILIVVVVIGILATLALSKFSQQKVQFQRQDFARQLKVYLERAKFDSIKRRAQLSNEMAKVTINSSSSYILASDLNGNGTLEATEVFPVTLPRNANVKIIGNTATAFPITVRFNFRGQATATDGTNSTINPVFTVCDSNCTLASASVDNSNIIAVSPTGTVSLINGGQSLPSAVQPNISNVSVGQKINSGGTVGN